MKRIFFFAALALLFGARAMAQTTDSEVSENKNYHRIYAGYAPTAFFTTYRHSTYDEWLHGFDVGWMSGFNMTKGKRLPLYLEAGVKANVGFGDDDSSFEKFFSVEVPLNVAYRFHIGNTKIHISPYAGLHFKVNAIARNNEGNSYFDIEGVKRFQFGAQAGGHFDFDHFYLGLVAHYDFLPFFDGGYKFVGNFFNNGVWDANIYTCGVNVNVGFVF